MWDRSVFKQRAKDIMKNHYWPIFLTCLVASLLNVNTTSGGSIKLEVNSKLLTTLGINTGITDATSVSLINIFQQLIQSAIVLYIFFMVIVIMLAGTILGAFVFNVLRVGFCRYLILTQRQGTPASMAELFWGFTCGNYLNLVKVMFFRDLYIFLWYLVLFIPGAIKTYEYYCVPFLLAEHPELDYRDVLAQSSAMTHGYKMDILLLQLSFLGWELLGTLLLGIGVYFVSPYIQLSNGAAYDFLYQQSHPDNFSDNGSNGSYESSQKYSY